MCFHFSTVFGFYLNVAQNVISKKQTFITITNMTEQLIFPVKLLVSLVCWLACMRLCCIIYYYKTIAFAIFSFKKEMCTYSRSASITSNARFVWVLYTYGAGWTTAMSKNLYFSEWVSRWRIKWANEVLDLKRSSDEHRLLRRGREV